MKMKLLSLVLLAFSASLCSAQDDIDIDIEFGFEDPDNPVFEVEIDTLTSEGILINSLGEFFSTPSGEATTDNPGFITPAVEEPGGIAVNAGDQVFVRVLDAQLSTSVGTGFVNFFNPNSAAGQAGLLESFGTGNELTVVGNIPGATGDAFTVFNEDGLVSGDERSFLAEGSDGTDFSDPPSGGEVPELLDPGQIHSHLGFDLSGPIVDTPGAIGLLLELEADLADGGGTVTSEPFFLVFNNGLDDAVFQTQALAAFGVATVPEPASAVVLLAAAGGVLVRRRRKRLVTPELA